jgi:hypothetical protein
MLFLLVMPGLVPGIHVIRHRGQDVDGRVKPGHDDGEGPYSPARLAALENFLFTRSRFSFDR